MAKKSKTPAPAPSGNAAPPPAGGTPPPPPPPGAPEGTQAPPPPPAPPAEPAKPKEPSANGVTRPSAGTTTRGVWETADAITKDKGRSATRAEVVAACSATGVNVSTATTQFGKWCKFNGLTADKSPGRTAKPVEAPAPGAPPAGAPDLQAVHAAGKEAYAKTAAGDPQGNPYVANTPECDAFVAGWNEAGTEATQAASTQ